MPVSTSPSIGEVYSEIFKIFPSIGSNVNLEYLVNVSNLIDKARPNSLGQFIGYQHAIIQTRTFFPSVDIYTGYHWEPKPLYQQLNSEDNWTHVSNYYPDTFTVKLSSDVESGGDLADLNVFVSARRDSSSNEMKDLAISIYSDGYLITTEYYPNISSLWETFHINVTPSNIGELTVKIEVSSAGSYSKTYIGYIKAVANYQ